MPAGLTLHRLHARTPARAEAVAARLALQALAADLEDAVPRSLPPQALLWLRRLHLQAPAAALARPGAVGLRQAWVSQGRERLDAALARAARPALGPVAPDAEAVLFADEAEMLACLALAARGGQLDRWWWRGLLGRHWPQWQSAWVARPQAQGAARRLLARMVRPGAALESWQEGEAADAASLAMAGGEPGPNVPLPVQGAGLGSEALAESAGPAPGEVMPAASAPVPWRVRPAGDEAPAARAMAPGQFPSDRAERGAEALVVPVAPHAAGAAQSAHAPHKVPTRAPAPGSGLETRPRAVDARPDEAAPTPGQGDGPAGRRPVAGASPALPALRRATPAASPSHLGTAPSLPPASPAAAPLARRDAAAPPPAAAMPVAPHPPAPASHSERPAELPPAAPLWPWPEARLSRSAPLLFIVNALLEDGLYPDFTRPRDPGLPVPLWALLAALARAWRLPPDPLLSLLDERSPPWQAGELPAAPGVAAGPWAEWLPAYARSLRRRLGRRLGVPPRRWASALQLPQPARLWVSEADWIVEFELAHHDVAWRLAGLDRDPGWLPTVDSRLQFRFR